mgnify:CR=1 FL=1
MNLLNLILSAVITCITTIIVIKNLSGINFNFKNFIAFSIIYLILMSINVVHFDGISRIVINIMIIITLSYSFLFYKNISNSVYYSLVYEIIAFIGEVLTSTIFVVIFKINVASYEKFDFSLLIFSIFNCLFAYLLSRNKFICKNVRKLNKLISKNHKDWIYIIIIMILLSLLLVFNKYNLGSGINYYINVGMVIFVVFSLIYVIYNKFQKQAIEDKYNESMEYVLRYEKIINEQGKKNHEYNNQLMVIKGYINKPERLSEYLDEVIGEHKTGQNYTVKQLGFLPDGGVKGLLYHKLSKMEDNNIKYYLYVDQNLKDKDIESFDLKTYRDLTKLLGVFLDNAIDAALKSEEKEIEVELKDKEDCLLLTISNTYDKNTDINKVGKSGFTTKGVGHGFGLSIVKDIAKTNSEIETFSSKESDKFIQTAMIYFKKKKFSKI